MQPNVSVLRPVLSIPEFGRASEISSLAHEQGLFCRKESPWRRCSVADLTDYLDAPKWNKVGVLKYLKEKFLPRGKNIVPPEASIIKLGPGDFINKHVDDPRGSDDVWSLLTVLQPATLGGVFSVGYPYTAVSLGENDGVFYCCTNQSHGVSQVLSGTLLLLSVKAHLHQPSRWKE